MNDTSIDADFNKALAYITKLHAKHAEDMRLATTVCATSIVINLILVLLAWVMP